MTTTDEQQPFEFEQTVRDDAHAILDRFLKHSEAVATEQYADGCSGYIGRIKICAFVNDEGLTLRVESSWTRDL